MDHKEGFEQRARRAFGPSEPGPDRPSSLTSMNEALFERLITPITETLPRTLEFRPKTGNWFSFPYHCLTSVEYRPHSEIRLSFTSHEVRVTGRDLARIYRDICAQNCESVVETERAEAFSDETRGHVEMIQVRESAK